jgi:hypothetical protein
MASLTDQLNLVNDRLDENVTSRRVRSNDPRNRRRTW